MTQDKPLNLYGDQLVATTGSHGPDIAGQRLDDLDKRALTTALTLNAGAVCVDLGCGFGWQGLRLALFGLQTHLFDLQPERPALQAFRSAANLRLHYHCGDLQHSLKSLPPHIELAFSQRFVHFLTFQDASELIQQVGAHMSTGACLFLSASGIDSELGTDYAGRTTPLEERFAPLAPTMAAKHHIHAPVCLYNSKDLRALVGQADLVTLELWASPFGNVKGVFQKR